MPQEDGQTLRQHLIAATGRDGAVHPRLADAPRLPDGCLPVWNAFLDLHVCRGNNGFGPAPLPYREIDAYQRMTGTRLLLWEVQALRRADTAYLAAWAEARNGR